MRSPRRHTKGITDNVGFPLGRTAGKAGEPTFVVSRQAGTPAPKHGLARLGPILCLVTLSPLLGLILHRPTARANGERPPITRAPNDLDAALVEEVQHANPDKWLRIEEFFRRGANPNARDEVGRTPLMWLMGEWGPTGPELKSAVELLLSRGADVRAVDRHGEDAVDIAARAGRARWIPLLARLAAAAGQNLSSSRVNWGDEHGVTALKKAVVHGDAREASILIQSGAVVDARIPRTQEDGGNNGGDGTTALFMAAEHGRTRMAQLLLARGADPNCLRGYSECIESTALIAASRAGATAIVRSLLAHGADPGGADRWGTTALHCAQNRDTAAALLAHGAAVDAVDEFGTPLMSAADRGDLGTIRILLAHGAAVNVRTPRPQHGYPELQERIGWTPLMSAVAKSSLPCARELLVHGAGVSFRDAKGRTALSMAIRSGNRRMSRLLREHGARE